MKVVIQPVNPGFKDYVLQYVSEVAEPHYTFVGVEGFGTYFVMFCQVKPYGMPTWPPLFDKDKYPRP